MPFTWHGEINKIVDAQAVKERIAGLGGADGTRRVWDEDA